MRSRLLSDSVFEALFRQAVIDNFFNELVSLPPREELAKLHIPSDAHKARIMNLCAKDARNEKILSILTTIKRAAAVILIAASLLFGSMMLVPDVRAAIIETIIEWYDKFVRFTSNAPESEKTYLEPTYIPEGFWEEFREELEMMTVILYTNEEGVIILFESLRTSGSLSFDNEGILHEIIRTDGVDYHIFTAADDEKGNSIIWETSLQRYSISSTIPIGIILEIAFSVGK